MLFRTWLIPLALLFSEVATAASFTYHGSLQDAGKPAQGSYDLELTLYSAPDGGKVIGGPLLLYAVPVKDGSFSTQADFGALVDAAGTTWLGVQLRRAGKGEYTALGARAPVEPAVTAATTSSVCPGAWTIAGNAGNPVGSYLGTADNQPLIFKVNGSQVGQITPSSDNVNFPDSPNVLLGSASNQVGTGGAAIGATVAGGGASGTCSPVSCGNVAKGQFSTVSGGRANHAQGDFSTIGGGDNNLANGLDSTVGGGALNAAEYTYSTVAGGIQNVAMGNYAAIGGGSANFVMGPYGVIGGGLSNQTSGDHSTVAGGANNNAAGAYSAVAGGEYNFPTGSHSFVAGGSNNFAGGDFSFAGGASAHVRNSTEAGVAGGDQGSFYWSDATAGAFPSTGPNQFLIRAQGGVAINDTPPNHDVELTIAQSAADTSNQASLYMRQSSSHAGVLLASGSASADPANNASFFIYNYNPAAPGSPAVQELSLVGGNMTLAGTVTQNSDRRIKHDIVPIEHALDTVLKLQPVSFRYNADYLAQSGQPDTPHLGFVAQDYAQVFPEAVTTTNQRVPGAAPDAEPIHALDPNPALITTVAALQELAAEVAKLREENADLRARMERLERDSGR